MTEFVHLHVHTQYSLLDGAIRVSDLMKRVSELGMRAVAMTDHGNMYGAVDFQKAAQKKGIKPIIGCEMYMTREEYDAEEKQELKSYHLTLLARSIEGYRNLVYLNSMAWLKGVHPRTGTPRINFDLLRQHNEGIIALSGDLGSEINQAILRGSEDEARAIARLYKSAFPADHYYLEIMDNALPEQQRCNDFLIALSEELDIPLVATNDCHYLTREDARAHAILMSIQLGKTVDVNRLMEHNVDQLYVRSGEEMAEVFSHVPQAIENTVKIAEMCDLTIPLGQIYLPKYRVPEAFKEANQITDLDESIHAYFRHISWEGLEKRFRAMEAVGVEYDEQVYRDRLQEELDIICKMDFPGYFLIVWDFINWAKVQGIPVGPGRGSGAGSLVAYSLEITNLDPIPYDLLFERFLNPERVSMPDFDIDFCMNRRGEVIQYVTQKYGEHNVGQIITYGQLKARACVRDVGRALGLSFGETDRLAKLIPEEIGITLKDALDREPRLRQARQEDPRVDMLFDTALSLENLNRQAGMHAAGIVISETPLWDYVPICRGANDELVTQFAKNEVEEAGLVKFDFLGLKTLTVLETAINLINTQREAAGQEPFDLETIPLTDRAIFKMISAGDTTGVFQLESSGFQELLKKLKPDCFEDIVAAVALYRPGPLGTGMVDDFIDRKHGRKKVEYPHPWLEDVLKPTYGVMVYQEQVMMTARVMAGYSLGGADLLRRCVTGDTLVTRADTGERVRVDMIEPGTPIHTIDDQLRVQVVPVQERMDNGTREVWRVRTRSGRTIHLTHDHPLLTVEGWRHLSDLRVGDAIAAPTRLPIPTTGEAAPERVKLLAYLIGDGQTINQRGHATSRFYNSDDDLLDDFEQCARTLGADTTRYTHDDTHVTTITCKGVAGAENPITALVKAAGIAARAEHKRLPDEVFTYTPELLRLFLGTLWSTDGSVERKRLSYSSSSPQLIDDLAHALLRLGIVTMRRARQTRRLPNYELIITDQRDVRSFAEQLADALCPTKRARLLDLVAQTRQRTRNQSIYNVPAPVTAYVAQAKRLSGLSWSQAGARVGIAGNNLSSGLNLTAPARALSRHRLAALADAFNADTLRRHADNDLLWDPIVEITPAGRQHVYDLAVPPHANFIAADLCIHNSMGKKKPEVMAQQKDVFVEGAVAKNVSAELAGSIFDLMAYFAGYGFNKSHSAAYALITYQTAYLKAHFPVEFMAALMTNDRDNTDKVVRFINEAKAMDIAVLPPDVNESQLDFSVTDGKIRFGLAAIKGVGAGVIESILEAREKGDFKSLYDFCARVDLKKCNKRTIEALVKCGAFDAVGPAAGSRFIGDHCAARASMMEAIGLAVERGQKQQHDRKVGQSSLFGMLTVEVRDEVLEETYPDATPWSDRELLKFERDLIGFYVTGHPLDRFEDEVSLYQVTPTSQITLCRGLAQRDAVTIAGVISEYRERPLKSGGRMAFLTLEDKTGGCEVLVFSAAFEQNEAALKSGDPLLIKGQFTIEGDADTRVGKVRAAEALRLIDARKRYVHHVSIELDADETTPEALTQLKTILRQHPGGCTTHLVLSVTHELGSAITEMTLPAHLGVEPSDELLTEIERLFRKKAVRLTS